MKGRCRTLNVKQSTDTGVHTSSQSFVNDHAGTTIGLDVFLLGPVFPVLRPSTVVTVCLHSQTCQK